MPQMLRAGMPGRARGLSKRSGRIRINLGRVQGDVLFLGGGGCASLALSKDERDGRREVYDSQGGRWADDKREGGMEWGALHDVLALGEGYRLQPKVVTTACQEGGLAGKEACRPGAKHAQTDRHTDTYAKSCPPRWACAPRMGCAPRSAEARGALGQVLKKKIRRSGASPAQRIQYAPPIRARSKVL